MEYNSDSDVEFSNENETLLNSNIGIVKRKKAAIVKTPFISPVEQPEEYYYSLILLYYPFRNEASLLEGHESSVECYQELFNCLRPNIANIHSNMLKKQEELQRALERISILRSQNQDLREELDLTNLSGINEALAEYGDDQNDDLVEPPVIVNQESLLARVQILNKEQLIAYNVIRRHIVNRIIEPIYFCLHGSGGTGKSYVARIILDLVNLQYSHNSTVNLPNVVVAAPTGVAAKNIKGVTCHSAFCLPIEKFKIGEYSKLKG